MRKLPHALIAAILIGLVTILTYGLLLPRLGFYRDDWYLLVTAQSEGTAGVINLFQIDRPLVGYFYALAYPLLDSSPIAWHLAALTLRLAGNLIFWRLLALVWPERSLETLLISLLFSVYPGYSVQPNAGVYSTDLAANAAALLSLVLMLTAMRARNGGAKIALSALALALEIVYLGLFESAIGLEIARLALVGYIVWRRDRGTTRNSVFLAIKVTAPYLLIAGAFLFWRLFLFESTRRATNIDVIIGRYAALPVRSVLSVGVEFVKDIFEATVLAWSVPFYNFMAAGALRDVLAALGAGLFVAALVLIVRRLRVAGGGAPASKSEKAPHRDMVALGSVIVVFALLPIVLAGRNVQFTDQWDRYTMYASGGAALVVGGLVFGFVRRSAQMAVLGTLIATSVAVHYMSAAWYRDFWKWQQDLWQQMTWRAPGLRAGTMLFVEFPAGGYQEGYEIYGPANIIYFPGQPLRLGGDVINSATVARLQLGKNRQHYDRTVLVDDNFANALVAVFPGNASCLHVLDGRKIELAGLMDDSLAAEAAAYSRVDLIDTAAPPAQLPTFLAGAPIRPWCRYYQMMTLARQRDQWDEVARLADEALAADATPDDLSEWMPALEAYASLGRLQDMRRTAAIIRSDDAARVYLCLQMQRGTAYPDPYDYNLVNQALCQAN